MTVAHRGKHSVVGGAAAKMLNYAIDAAELPYVIPIECVIKLADNRDHEP